MDALMGGGLGGFNPMMSAMPMMAAGGIPPLASMGGGSPLGGGLGDGFMASPELAGMGGSVPGFEGLDCSNPLMSGLTGFEGLDVGNPMLPGGGTAGLPDFSSMMGGMPGMDMGSLGGMDMGLGGLDMMGGGSLANQAAGLQSAMMDGNLANAALLGADAVGLKNGAMQNQLLGDAATYGLR